MYDASFRAPENPTIKSLAAATIPLTKTGFAGTVYYQRHPEVVDCINI